MKQNKVIMQIAGILVLITVAYWSTLKWLYERYVGADSYYSHGFLVPLVTGYFIWAERETLKKIDIKSNVWGLVLIITSLLIHVLSMLAEVYFVSGYSLFLLVFGISLYVYGREITKKILFPLSFLFFMFPLPLVAINAISFPMKMIATKAGVFVMQSFMHLPLRNEGFEIYFPKASLVVGNPCSGLRSLISMLALSSIFAYMMKDKMWKRVSLVAVSVPIALFSNICRVVMLSVAVFIYGSKMAQGFFHDFTGYVVFVIEFGLLWFIWRKMQCKE